jgi:hypothetical protein
MYKHNKYLSHFFLLYAGLKIPKLLHLREIEFAVTLYFFAISVKGILSIKTNFSSSSFAGLNFFGFFLLHGEQYLDVFPISQLQFSHLFFSDLFFFPV